MGLERSAVEGAPQGSVSFVDVMSGFLTRAGLKFVVKSPDMIMVPYDLDGGRKQNAFVVYHGQDGAKQNLIGVFSPALKMPKDQEIGQKTANQLLRRNAKLAHGAWAVVTIGGDDYLGCFETQALETMQPEELKYACLTTCLAADALEKEFGTDAF
jgi:hypothetical protein